MLDNQTPSTTTPKNFLTNIRKKSHSLANFNFNVENKIINEEDIISSVKSKGINSEVDKENRLKEAKINSNDKMINNENKQLNDGLKTQLDFLQANPPNRIKVLKDVLLKMDLFRLNPPNMNKIVQYFTTKVELSKGLFYNFIM